MTHNGVEDLKAVGAASLLAGMTDEAKWQFLTEFLDPIGDEFEWPSYSEKGDILVEVIVYADNEKPDRWTRFSVEEYCSGEGSTVYVNEGTGVEYFVNSHFTTDDFPVDGWYVIEGVHGAYIRGDGWTTDDDEEWYWEDVRPATVEEIAEYYGASFWDSE